MRKSSIGSAMGNRIWRDLIHNPLHLISSVDVLGMTSSTLASLSKGFAELSTDGKFLQLRSKQVTSLVRIFLYYKSPRKGANSLNLTLTIRCGQGELRELVMELCKEQKLLHRVLLLEFLE